MPLDPQVEQWLSTNENAPPLTSLTPQEARRQMLEGTALLGPPEPIAAVEDAQAPGPAGLIPLRLYRPNLEARLPAIVYFHGGGWVMGSIDTHDAYCRALANACRAAVVAVDYRLAPEHKYPAAMEDAYAATKWIAEQAELLGIESTRLAVAGDSAGGNLAAAVTLAARDRGKPPLALQILIYPITDHCFDRPSYNGNATGYHLTTDSMKWFWQHYLSDSAEGEQPLASPLRCKDLSGLPPAVVVTARYDPLRDEGQQYAVRLQEAGVATELWEYDGMIHGFARRLNSLDRARELMQRIAAHFQQAV